MAFTGDGEIGGIECSQDVKIEETVIEGRDQRIRHGMGKPHQIGVHAGGIDNYHVMAVLDGADCRRKALELLRFVRLQRITLSSGDAVVRGQFQGKARALGPGAPIIDVVSETLLTRIEVNGRNALASFEKRHGDVQGRRGFPRAAFLVAEHDDMGGLRIFLNCVDQGAAPLRPPIVKILAFDSQVNPTLILSLLTTFTLFSRRIAFL